MVRELERKRQSAKFPETAPAANPLQTKSKCPSGSCNLPVRHSNISPKSIPLNLEARKTMLPNHRITRDEILAIVVLISVLGLFTLALIDPSARSTFADLAKVTVGAYIGLLMPKGGGN
ncbi:hypothetical protein [Nostoc sp. CALU 546]|uniref:hypothetical protein n=1 Tax=Nostoc sp. CALU 546 TaxID=1867241 RepID=UPI003B675FBA